MFKKKPTIKALAPLRSSDRRRLADQIINDYNIPLPVATIESSQQDPSTQPDSKKPTDAATLARTSLRNALLPENVQSARFTTPVGPDLKPVSGTIYVGSAEGESQHDARILWFQIDNALLPSMYTLWRHAGLVPLLHTPGMVVQKLQGGADLMTPGLANGPPFPAGAKKGEVVAVASLERPSVPIVLGRCLVDVAGLGSVQGAKGHAVENLHWVGDEIWGWSGSGKKGVDAPEELVGWERALRGEEGLVGGVEKLAIEDEEDDEGGGGVQLNDGHDVSKTDAADSVQTEPSAKQTEASTAADSVSAQPEYTQKEIDQAFRNAFLYGVHRQKQLNPNTKNFGLVFPLSQSAVMSTLVQPFLPAFTPAQSAQLQIKKTSFKNIKKFIKSLDKEMIIKSKDQDGNQTVIFDIDFVDKAFVDFKPYRLPKKESNATNGASGAGDDAADASTSADGAADDAVGQKLQVIISYKPAAKQQPLFDAATAASSSAKPHHYSSAEVREALNTYIDSENLPSATNRRLIQLNPILASSVFDGSGPLDKEVLAKGSVPREALLDRVLHSMATSYAIVRLPIPQSPPLKFKSGTPPKILLTLETRSGNKTVTKISGLESYHIAARPLADELRKTCAGATSVEALAGAAKKFEKEVLEVMVQGPQKDAVMKALERRGVDVRKWVDVVDKVKKKGGR